MDMLAPTSPRIISYLSTEDILPSILGESLDTAKEPKTLDDMHTIRR